MRSRRLLLANLAAAGCLISNIFAALTKKRCFFTQFSSDILVALCPLHLKWFRLCNGTAWKQWCHLHSVPKAPCGEANSFREIMKLNLCGCNIAESETKNRWFHRTRPPRAKSYLMRMLQSYTLRISKLMWLETTDREEQLIPEGILIFESIGCFVHVSSSSFYTWKHLDALVKIFLSAQ